MPKDFNYKTALAIFLSSEKGEAISLNAYDLAYLYTVANAQDLNPTKQICIMARPVLAKNCRMSFAQLIRVEEKMKKLGLIKLKKVWKMYRRILGEPICSSPIQWNSEKRKPVDKSSVTTPMDKRSQLQWNSDHNSNRDVTIEIVEKESIEKESSASRTTFLQDLEAYKPNQKLIDLSRTRGYEVEQLRMKFIALTKGSGRKYVDLNSAFEYFILSEKGSFKPKVITPITAAMSDIDFCSQCRKNLCICKVSRTKGKQKIAEIMSKMGLISRN